MNFFQQVTNPSQGTQETLVKEYVHWAKGLKLGPLSEERRANVSAGLKGVVRSAETRAKMSASKLGVPKSELACANMRKPKKAHSTARRAEHNAKIAAGNKGKFVSDETRARQSASMSTPVMTPHGLFPSVRAVVEASGYNKRYVYRWMKKYPNDFYYVNKGE